MSKLLEDIGAMMSELGNDYQSIIGPFGVLKRNAEEKDGALGSKYKKLIAIALAVAKGCEWCIAMHTKAALDAGATREEILEACFVSVLMDGSTSLMHIKPVLDSIKEFSGCE